MKKLLLTLGTIATIATPVACVISCGSSTPDATPPKQTPPGTTPGTTPPDQVPPTNTGPVTTPAITKPPVSQPVTPGVSDIVKTLDLADPAIERNIIIDKDGKKLTPPVFTPVKGIRSQARNPHAPGVDPKPITVMAEPFTRTTSPGAMDVTGWTPAYTDPSNTPLTLSALKEKMRSFTPPSTTVAPIAFDEFTKIDDILSGHLLIVSEDLSTQAKIEAAKNDGNVDLIDKLMNEVNINNLKACGISAITDFMTIQTDTGLMLGHSITRLTLKNVVFALNGNTTWIPVDINILITK